MADGYKNILANAYMRDTNYLIIKDTDDIDDLEDQWNNFLSLMTPRQQRLSDDKSIEIWNKTNQQHYEYLKMKLEKKVSSLAGNDNNRNKIKPDNLSNDIKPYLVNPIDQCVTGYEDHSFDIMQVSDLDEEYLEESERIHLTEPEDQHPETADDYARLYDRNSNYNVIGGLKGDTVGEKLEDLEKQYSEFRGQSNEIMRKSDDVSRQLYGLSNQERYNKLKSDLLNSADETTVEKSPLGENSFVMQCAKERLIRNLNESNTKRRDVIFTNTPYFTPDEMIDLGVHGNNNRYSANPDNDKLVGDISIPLWFDSYKDMCMDHVFEDYRKEWLETMRILYSDYNKIKESGDQERILSRKQSILDLGWNPEIDFETNKKYASCRVKDIIQSNYPVDQFIKLDSIPELPEEELNEAVDNNHKPVFLVLTKGQTPVISQGIKFVTKSEYSHASITFDPELNDVYSFNMRQNNWGFIKENLSSFKDNVISVFAFFAEKPIVTKLKKTVYDFANHKTNFDLRIFANKIFHINHKASNDQYQQVCSTFVDTVLKSGGINLVGDQEIPAPSDIYNGAKSQPNKIFEVYYGIAPKYNGRKVKRQIAYLMKNKDTLSINDTNQVKEFQSYIKESFLLEAQLPKGVTLRNATKDDTDDMIKWELESVDSSLRKDPKVIKFIKDDVKVSIPNTKMIMYNDETIGMFTTDRLTGSDYWYIGEIYIVKEHRGKGIGTTLIKNEIAKHNKIKLQVAQSNKSAQKLYESLGFKITETNDKNKMYVMTLDKSDLNEHSKNTTTYFRITYNGIGVYEALKNEMFNINNDSSEWDKFKRSKACTWLPIPSGYSDGKYSYFTEEGYNMFLKKTYPDIIKYLDEDKIEITEHNNINTKSIVYKDKYQIVTNSKINSTTLNKEHIAYMVEANIYDGLEKVDNLSYDKLYFGAPEKYKVINKTPLFVTPFKGLASIFCLPRDPKSRERKFGIPRNFNYNLGYNEWHLDNRHLTDYLDEVNVRIEGIPDYEYRTVQCTGYIHEIDINDVKDNIYINSWMSREDKEFIIIDIDNIKVTKVEKHTITANLKGYPATYKSLIANSNLKESAFVFVNEQKKFPVEFDEDGNLIIYKCRMGNIDYGDEIDKTAELLENYRNTSDVEGMKYELARLWFIIDSLEKAMTKKNIKKEVYDEYVRNRATAKNIFKQNFSIVIKYDKTFNFAEYYHNTPFSDHSVKVTHNTLKYSAKALLSFLK